MSTYLTIKIFETIGEAEDIIQPTLDKAPQGLVLCAYPWQAHT